MNMYPSIGSIADPKPVDAWLKSIVDSRKDKLLSY